MFPWNPVDSSSDVMAYATTTHDYIFNVASTTTINCLYFQTTYDMADDIAIFPFSCSPRISYWSTSVYNRPNPCVRNHNDFGGTFVWTTFHITSFVGLYDLITFNYPLHHHRHSLHLQLPHIRCQLNILSLLHLQQRAQIRQPTTLLHPLLRLPPDQHFRQHGQLLLLQFMNRQYHLHHYHVHLTHYVFTNLNQWLPLHQHLPQLLLDKQQWKQLQRFAPRRKLKNHVARLQRRRRPRLLMLPQLHRLHLRYSKTWQHWALRLNNSRNRSVLSRLNSRWYLIPNASMNNDNNNFKTYHQPPLLLQRHCPHRHYQPRYLPLHRKPDPLNLQLRTTIPPRLHLHPFRFPRHHHRDDPDQGQEDHAPLDRLGTLIADILLVIVQIDLVLPFHGIAPQPNIQKIAEHLPPTAEDHHLDDVHHYLIDATDQILQHAPELLSVILEAMKWYLHQQHVLRTQISFPHQMLMTLGELGTIVTIQKTIVVTHIDPDPRRDHHLLIHLQTHRHPQQHHSEPWPIVSQMATAKHLTQQRHIQSHNSTRMTSTSTNLFRQRKIQIEHDASPNWAVIIQCLYSHGARPPHQALIQQFRWRDVQPVGQTLSYNQQRAHLHQSKSGHSHEHRSGIRTGTTPWWQSCTENTGLWQYLFEWLGLSRSPHETNPHQLHSERLRYVNVCTPKMAGAKPFTPQLLSCTAGLMPFADLYFDTSRTFKLAYCYYPPSSILWSSSTPWRLKTWSPNSAKNLLVYRPRNPIDLTLLDRPTKIGIILYRRFVDPCTMQWRPFDLFGLPPEFLLHHHWPLRSPHAQPGHLRHQTHYSHLHHQPFHKHLLTIQHSHLNDTTPLRDRRCLWHHLLELLQFARATLVVQLKFHRWTSGNLMSTFTTLTRWMVWISPPRSAKVDFPQLQGHRGYGSFTGPTLEILVPRASQYLASSHCLRTRNFCPSFWQHWHYTVFIAELVSQLCTRNVDLDKLATFKSRSAGQFVNQKEATQNMAKEVAQLLQSWLPSQPSADNASQQRILELEAELAKMKSDNAQNPPTTPEAPGQASTPIGRALQGQTSASTSFDPSSLLVSPGSVNQWLVDNQPSSLTETQYKKWLKDLKLPQHKQDTLEKQLEKVT